MSLSSAMLSAVSGLTTSGRLAGVASNNIANAETPGYVRRSADVSSVVLGGQATGVSVEGIRREISPLLLAERRKAEASAQGAAVTQAFLMTVETALGAAESPDSLTGRIAAFESALISAASRPESQSQITSVLTAAQKITDHLNTGSSSFQAGRAAADAAIGAQVTQLNDALSRVAQLNEQIRVADAAGADSNNLQDLRQKTVDAIASIIPVKEYAREGGAIALYSTSGATLVDGRASVFGFESAGAVSAGQTIGNGALSGLTLNGREIATDGGGLIAGGALAANFDIRDRLAPQLQDNLDAVARNLIERFQDPSVDSTLVPGSAGLFTDAGSAFMAPNEAGLSGRIAINAAVDPANDGELWRIRDGIGALVIGNSGDSALLARLKDALTTLAAAGSGANFSSGQRSFASFASDLVSDTATRRLDAEAEASFASARLTAVTEQEAAGGVDTDAELQNLMLIEQAYAANARVLQVLDEMLQTVMEI